jgi:hypothetical protein
MRDQVYSFCGCILDGMEGLAKFQPGGEHTTRGMNTEGILRLLAGETIRLYPEDVAKVRKQYPALPKWTGQWNSINPTQIKAILWTPVTDATFLYPAARCDDRTVYPIHDGFLNGILGSGRSTISFRTMFAVWEAMDRATSHIPLRAIVQYPTDHLGKSDWKERIDRAQFAAEATLPDWEVFAPEPDLTGMDGYWAHFSIASRQKLWAAIQERLPP